MLFSAFFSMFASLRCFLPYSLAMENNPANIYSWNENEWKSKGRENVLSFGVVSGPTRLILMCLHQIVICLALCLCRRRCSIVVEVHKMLVAIYFYQSDKRRTYLPDAKILFFFRCAFSVAISSELTHIHWLTHWLTHWLVNKQYTKSKYKFTDVFVERNHTHTHEHTIYINVFTYFALQCTRSANRICFCFRLCSRRVEKYLLEKVCKCFVGWLCLVDAAN